MKRWQLVLLTCVVVGLLLAFSTGPVLLLVVKAALSTAEGAVALVLDERAAIASTLWISLGSALLALAVGTPLALLLHRTDVPFRRLASALLLLPSAIPPFIWGMGWISLANPKAGFLNRLLGASTFDVYGAGGIIFVLGAAGVPLVLLNGAAALSRMDPALEEAARICGAGPMRALATTTLPLAFPMLASGAVMVFLSSASAFGVPYMLGVAASPPTTVLTTRVYGRMLMGGQANLDAAAALSAVLLLLAPVVLVVSSLLSRAGRVRIASGKGISPRPMPLGRLRWPLGALCAATTLVLVLLPLGAVTLTSFQSSFGAALEPGQLTTRHWAELFSNTRLFQAAVRSFGLALGAGVMVCAVGLLVAVLRPRLGVLGQALKGLSMLPYSAPGTVVAIALLVAFSHDVRFVAFERVAFVLALANSSWLLLVAYAGKTLALGVQTSSETLYQLDPSLPEAARVFGASPWRAFVDATLPLLRPSLGTAFLLVFLTCATELTMSVLLVPPGQEVLGTMLFELQTYADPSKASVLACAFVALVLAVRLGVSVLSRRGSVGAPGR